MDWRSGLRRRPIVATATAAIVLAASFASPAIAAATDESVGGCIVDAVRDAEALGLPHAEAEARAATAVEEVCGESVGACIVDAVRNAEALDLSDEEIKSRAATAAEEVCVAAPNPILPAWSETIRGFLSLILFVWMLIGIGALVRLAIHRRRNPPTTHP